MKDNNVTEVYCCVLRQVLQQGVVFKYKYLVDRFFIRYQVRLQGSWSYVLIDYCYRIF